jgi:hypothetical protein
MEDSKVIKTIKNDIYDTLRDMDNASEHPRKEYSVTISETESTVENFEDTNNINSNLAVEDIIYDSNYALFELGSKITISGLTELVEIKLIFGTEDPPVTVDTETYDFTITPYNARGEAGTVTTINVARDVASTHTLSVALNDRVGGTCVIECTAVPATNPTYARLNSLTWTVNDYEIEMPADTFIPFEAVFYPDTIPSNPYVTKEMYHEQYMKWNPNIVSLISGEINAVTDVDEQLSVQYQTEENIEYDWKIGYYFHYEQGKVYLRWKPKFTGTVTILYAYIPSRTIAEETAIDYLEVFTNCLVYGTTERQLDKMLLDSETELASANIRALISRYSAKYRMNLDKYAGFRRLTQTHVIKPNDILSDTGMIIQF